MTIVTQPITTPPHLPPPTHPLSTSISKATSLLQLKQIHTQILHQNLNSSNTNSLLLHLILSSLQFPSSLHYSLSIFSSLQYPKTHLTDKLFRELSRSKEPVNALLFYEYGRRNGLEVDRFSFPPLLKAASRGLALREGMEIHGLGCKLGFDDDPFVQTALLGMYANCGKIEDARLVFDKMSQRDIVTWDIMIDGYYAVLHLII